MKKILALFLVLATVLSLMTVGAYAAADNALSVSCKLYDGYTVVTVQKSGTVYYTTDGTCYQYNVSGLTPGRQYKVYISYDSTRYYITGGLKVQGLGSEELTTIENENTVQ